MGGHPVLHRSTVGDAPCSEELEAAKDLHSPRHHGRPEGRSGRQPERRSCADLIKRGGAGGHRRQDDIGETHHPPTEQI
jgi:hypothetical protein